MKCSLFDGGEDGGHTGVCLLKDTKIFATQAMWQRTPYYIDKSSKIYLIYDWAEKIQTFELSSSKLVFSTNRLKCNN